MSAQPTNVASTLARELAEARARHVVFVSNCKRLLEAWNASVTPVLTDVIIPLLDEYGFTNWAVHRDGLDVELGDAMIKVRVLSVGYTVRITHPVTVGNGSHCSVTGVKTLDEVRGIITIALALVPQIAAARSAVIAAELQHKVISAQLAQMVLSSSS